MEIVAEEKSSSHVVDNKVSQDVVSDERRPRSFYQKPSRNALLSSTDYRQKKRRISSIRVASTASTSTFRRGTEVSRGASTQIKGENAILIPPMSYSSPWVEEPDQMHGKDIFFQGQGVVWRDVYGSPASPEDYDGLSFGEALANASGTEGRKIMKDIAAAWTNEITPLLEQMSLNKKVARSFFGSLDPSRYAKAVSLKSSKSTEPSGFLLCLRYCNSKGDTLDMIRDEETRINVGGLTNRFMIIFTHQEVISIHRTDIKALWKIRQKWKDIGSKPKCNNVCYIVNKLLQVVVLSYEKAITADIYQIDRDYSRVMIAEKEESEELVARATRIKRRTQVFSRILKLQMKVTQQYKQFTGQEDEIAIHTLDESVKSLALLVDGLLESADQLINLHISVRDHQANNTLNKLTFLSSVFLPLSFTSGVYGMNFVNIPELEWGFGYAYFWLVIAGLTFAICSYYKYKGYF